MKYSKKVSDTLSWFKRFKKEKKIAFYQAPRLNKPHVYQNSTG